jgi:hypothetical protein
MVVSDSQSDLSAFQLEVAKLFFTLPASRGFLLAGGAALLAQHLTTRPTEDLDFFTASGRGHVPAACAALEAAALQRGWVTERIHDSDTFCRMAIRSADAGVLIDLAVNAPPDLLLPRLRPGRRWPRRNSLATSCLPCLTGQPHGIFLTFTSWPVNSARTYCSRGPHRSMQASTSACSLTCSLPSIGSPMTR